VKRLILDFSSRLPGPLATSLLPKEFFDVMKVEFLQKPDAFTSDDLRKVDPIFYQWYQNINKNKKKVTIATIDDLNELIGQYDWILALGNFKEEESTFFQKKKIHTLTILGGAKERHRYLHDLNALVLSRSFQFHKSLNMPHLPFAGVNFAQAIKSKILEITLNDKIQNERIYLKEETLKVFDLLSDDKLGHKHLHNGKFPCYNLYQTKDKRFVALSAIEERFWKDFCDVFDLKFTAQERFSVNPSIFQQISKVFGQYNGQKLQDIVDTNGLLITIY
jgi:hypothetical protein